jgi:protein gp37
VDVINKKRTTGIEWTDHTWNPFVGCSMISEGCRNCYAMALAYRLAEMGNKTYNNLTKKNTKGKAVWSGQIRMNSKNVLNKPLLYKQPSIFFVNSMSDFFHDNATDAMRIEALEIMKNTPIHQYQILTKRPENVKNFFDKNNIKCPDNVWLGATVEDGRVKDRLDYVRKYPSKIRFVSIEPLTAQMGKQSYKDLSWVITGGESGHYARPCNPDWLREIRDDLLKFEVPHFFKQWGKNENNPLFLTAPKNIPPNLWVEKNDPIGKGGSLLDNKYFKEMPLDFKVAEFRKELQDDLFKQ